MAARTKQHGAGREASPSSDEAASNQQVKPASRRPLVLAAVILFSIIMVGSILLPSLSAIVSGVTATREESSTTSDAETDASDEDSATATLLNNINARYESKVSTLETKLTDAPDNAAALINLANDYYEWATTMQSYASTDDEQAHVSDLFTKAMDYYDRYLALEDANAARANRAMCQFNLGDTAAAQAALEQLTSTTAPDFAPAWADLGRIYTSAGDTEKATDAYNKVLEVDPDDKYGLKSTAEQTLSLFSSEASATSSSTSSDAETSSESSESLADALSSEASE